MARKIEDFYCNCDYAFLERTFDGYVFNINKPTEPIVTEIDGYKRCSNFALNAFDISIDDKVYGSIDVKDYLKEQGFKIIDFYVHNKIIENFRNNYEELTKNDIQDNLKAIYYPAWNTMTVKSFCASFKGKGSFIVGTKGGHTLAYHKNKLWDSQGKGFNKSKIVLGFQVLTKEEYDSIANLKDLPDEQIKDFLFNLSKVEAFPKIIKEAEYKGRKVTLNKPMKGDTKKYKVYVTNPDTGNVKKVEFGDKGMSIKRDDPARRRSFRARHKCDQKKDKTTAGYWSCKLWGNKPVSDILKGESYSRNPLFQNNTSVSLYDEHQEFLYYANQLYGFRNLKEFSIPSWIKSKVPDWIKDKFYFIKELALSVKADFFQLLQSFKDKYVYKLFTYIEWDLKQLWDLVKKGFKVYSKIQLDIANWVAESSLGQAFVNDLKALDEFFDKHPYIKKVGGVLVAALLIFIWLNMTFTGDFEYDFNLSTVILALASKFTLYQFFGTDEGIRMLILLATGVLFGLTFPWPGPDSIKYLTAVVVSLMNYVNNTKNDSIKKISDDRIEDEAEAAEEILDVKQESLIRYESIYSEGIKYKYVIRDRKKVKKPYTDNPNKKIVYVDDKPKEVIKTSREKRNRRIGSKKAVKKAKKKMGMALKKRRISMSKRTWDK